MTSRASVHPPLPHPDAARPSWDPGRTGRSRTRTVIALALPIVGGMASQNILNLVDTAMVGSLGDTSLAAVGTASFANFVAVAFLMGLSSGVQAMAARRKGAGRTSETAIPLNGALLVDLAIAIPLTAVLLLLAPILFPYLNGNSGVVDEGVPYLSVRLLSVAGIGMNFAFRGYWNGISRPGLYMRTLLIMHTCNIFLNWVLIFGNLGAPTYGSLGAGIASTISIYVGTSYYLYLGLRHGRASGFLRALPDRETIRTMLRLALPTGVQQLLFSASFLTLFWILGHVGTSATAAAHVLISLMLVAILPCMGLGMAGGSLVGQTLGRKDPEDARRWGWDTVKIAAVVMVSIGALMIVFADPVLRVFLHDPATVDMARAPFRVFGATIGMDAVGMVLLNALLGAGASRQAMFVSVGFQWGFMLPVAYLVGPVLQYGLLGIWVAQAIQRAMQAGVFAWIWQRGSWTRIDV